MLLMQAQSIKPTYPARDIQYNAITDNLKIRGSRVRWIRVDALRRPVRVFFFTSAPFGIFCCVYVLYRLLSKADSVFTQRPLLWGRSCCNLFTILFRAVFCCFYLLLLTDSGSRSSSFLSSLSPNCS